MSGVQSGSGGYRQIMADVRSSVCNGAIAAGAPVPSITEQAARLGCARGTVSRAYRRLAADGVLMRVPGLGYFAAGTHGRARAMPGRCKYQQVAAHVAGLITTGHLPPGRSIAVCALARQHRCSHLTAAKALNLLASDGLIARRSSRHSYYVTKRRSRPGNRLAACR